MILVITISVVLQFLIVFYALKFKDLRGESLTWIAVASGFFILALWNSVTLLQIFLRTLTKPIDPVSELIVFTFSGFVFGGLFTLSKKEATRLDSSVENLISNINNAASFFQNMPFAMLAVDMESNLILAANEASSKLFGYSIKEIVGSPNSIIYPPESKRQYKELFSGNISSEKDFTIDLFLIDKSGERFPVEANANVTAFDGRDLIYVTYRDISQRNKRDIDLDYKSMLLDKITDTVIAHDFSGNILYANEAAYKTRGYTKEEFLSMEMSELLTDESAKEFPKRIRRLMETGPFIFRSTHRLKDGGLIHVEVNPKLIEHENGKAVVSVIRDLAEQKEIESEIEFKSYLINEVKESILVHDLEGNFLYINKAAHEERDYTRDEMMKMNLSALVTPDHIRQLTLNFDKILDKGTLNVSAKNYRKDGSVMHCEVSAKVIDYNGEKVIASVVRDVSEINKVMEDLRLHAMVAENASDSIIVHNNENIFYANKTAYTSRGYSKEEFLALPLKELIREDKRDIVDSRWAISLIKGEDLEFESVHLRKDGTVFPVEVKSKIIEYGGDRAALSITRDISEHKKAISLIKESEEKYRNLSESIDDDVLIIDKDFTFTYVNNVSAGRYSMKQDDFIGKKVSDMHPPEIAEQIKERVGTVIDSAEAKIYESQIRQKNGVKYLNTKMTPIKSSSGSIESVLIVARDFTDIKLAEIKAKQAEHKYQTLINLANDAVFVADAESGILIDANKAAEKLIKKPTDEIIGMHQTELHPSEESDNYRQIFNDGIKRGPSIIESVFAIDSAGNKIPVEISSSLMEINGKPIIMGIFRDVSSRKKRNELNEALNDINATIHSSMNIEERLERVLKTSSSVLNSYGALILLRGENNWIISDIYNLKLQKGKRLSDSEAKCAMFVAANNETLIVDDIDADPRANSELLKKLDVGSFIALPLMMKGKTIGVLDFYFKIKPMPMNQNEIDFTEKLATSISLAIENASLYDAEANIANTLQEALLKMPDHIHGGIFGSIYKSASKAAKVGGDFYDIFELEHNKVGVLIGDVSGKGLGAASLTTLIKNSIRAASYDFDNPSKIVSKVNKIVTNMTNEYMYVTVFFGIVDVVVGDINYCLAGHPSPIIRRMDGKIDYLSIVSPPIGVMKDLNYLKGSAKLSKGDVLINYTDGLIEAREEDAFFGEARLEKLIKETASRSVKELPQVILKEVENFSSHNLSDDMAILTFQINHYE